MTLIESEAIEALRRDLLHHGGLRAEIVASGIFRVGDPIVQVER